LGADAECLRLGSRAGLAQAPIPGLAETGCVRLAELYGASGKPEEARECARNN